MSRRLAPGHGGRQSRAFARYCRKHDVHDADAADQERNRGNGAQNDIEQALGFLRLPQQFERHDNLVIVLVVKAAEQCSDLEIGRLDRFGVAHLDRDLVQLHLLGFNAAGAAADEDVSKTRPGGSQGNVNVVVQGSPSILPDWLRCWG